MIIRWLAIGESDGSVVDDTVITVLNNIFYNPDSDRKATTMFNRLVYRGNSTAFPIAGIEKCVETALNIVLNRHVNDGNYKLCHLYRYRDDGILDEYTINDYMEDPKS